jgi:hypothetical protein
MSKRRSTKKRRDHRPARAATGVGEDDSFRLPRSASVPNFAETSSGAIAQLGERYNGIVEVTGSIPVGSTN